MLKRNSFIVLMLCLGMLMGIPAETFAQGAQKHKVTGVVKDESGEPLIGVTVAENGIGNNGVITDLDGNFSITVSPNASLTFSYVGYVSQIVKVAGKSNLACIFHTLGKKPLIDEWHTPAKAVFSFYDKSLQP